jgi:RNA polymerase sigma-70 factor (ECF subfamily)
VSRTRQFEALRPLLFSIAYRLLGSVGEAEDAVQETWLHWQAAATEPVSVKSYLSTVVTRISIDVLRSARVRRETYPGPWFPEPLLQDPYEDPERAAELADSLTTAALLLLERLSPLERAVFVLREVFGFGFAEIAATVQRSEPACRQLAARARAHMAQGRSRFRADRAAQRELAARFLEAMRAGDVDALREVLAADVLMVADGGGKGPLWGSGRFAGVDTVARLLASVAPPFAQVGATLQGQELNGQPGAIVRDRDGRVLSTFSLEVLDGRIATIRGVTNPDKLLHVGPVADQLAVQREAFATRRRGVDDLPQKPGTPSR